MITITLTHDSINPNDFSTDENSNVVYTGEFETVDLDPSLIHDWKEEVFETENESCHYLTVFLAIEGNEEEVEIVHLDTTIEEFEAEMEELGYEIEPELEEESEAKIFDLEEHRQRKAA